MEAVFRKNPAHTEDPYYEGRKYPEPTVCPECGAVFIEGRWTWKKLKKDSFHKEICPACRRKKEKYPGGLVLLEGKFLKKHMDEITNRIEHIEEQEKNLRPLNRILWINKKKDFIEIATTTEHLARKIGEGINSAYKGELTLKYSEHEKLIRVHWKRD